MLSPGISAMCVVAGSCALLGGATAAWGRRVLVLLVGTVSALAVTIGSAGAADVAYSYNFVNNPPSFCANAYAEVNTDVHLVVTGISFTSTHNGSGCTSYVNWPSGDIAARPVYYWDGGICDQASVYTYNPAPYQSTAYRSVDFSVCGTAGVAHASVATDSWVLVGYPASWIQGYEQTSSVLTS